MKRFVTVRSLILVFTLLLGIIPVSAAERPFASNGNGVATFITDGAGNVVGATVVVSGNGTQLGLFTGTGTTPANSAPKNATGMSLVSCITSITRSSGRKPNCSRPRHFTIAPCKRRRRYRRR